MSAQIPLTFTFILLLTRCSMESLNGRIKNIIRNGYGYKNFRRLRNKVMYSLNWKEPIRIA